MSAQAFPDVQCMYGIFVYLLAVIHMYMYLLHVHTLHVLCLPLALYADRPLLKTSATSMVIVDEKDSGRRVCA